MRQIVLDTETTGLSPAEGDRIIEIGCVEIVNRRITGREFQTYVNPEGKQSHPMALAKHGLTDEQLAFAPLFADVRAALGRFLAGADELIAHNAPFDIEFLEAELERVGINVRLADKFRIVDTMRMSGLSVGGSLDKLLDRYKIDRSERTLHGALIDSRLLAQAYLAMTRGNDELDVTPPPAIDPSEAFVAQRPVIPVVRATGEELAAHDTMMERIRRTA